VLCLAGDEQQMNAPLSLHAGRRLHNAFQQESTPLMRTQPAPGHRLRDSSANTNTNTTTCNCNCNCTSLRGRRVAVLVLCFEPSVPR
jgi:hypothetical protein